MDLGETAHAHVDWIQLTQDVVQWEAFVNTVINLHIIS